MALEIPWPRPVVLSFRKSSSDVRSYNIYSCKSDAKHIMGCTSIETFGAKAPNLPRPFHCHVIGEKQEASSHVWKFLCVLMAFWKSFRAILGNGAWRWKKALWQGWQMHFWETRLCHLSGQKSCGGELAQLRQMTTPRCICSGWICTQFHEQFVHIWQKCFLVSVYNSSGTKYTPLLSLEGNQNSELARTGILENVTPAREKNPWESSADQHW